MNDMIRSHTTTYKIMRMIGEGLSGRVYLASREDARYQVQHEVALKILKSETQVRWLKQEFAALLRVRSPYCVRVLGWEALDEGPALVLEYVEGLSLFELARECRLTNEMIDELTTQIQQGLEDLAGCGLFHGDLSPKNILMDITGTVRLIDFGTYTETHEAVGTPAYLAPECWAGEKRSLQSDLFALGLIRHDLLKGSWPSANQVAEYRSRVMGFASDQPGLLSLDKNQRQVLHLRPDAGVRAELAQKVQEILHRRANLSITTQFLTEATEHSQSQLHGESLRLSKRILRDVRWAVAGLALMLAAPVSSNQSLRNSFDPGHVEVRTVRWFKLTLDGQEIGYSPMQITGLSPGTHQLDWASAKSKGTLVLKVAEGARILLTDQHFDLVP